MRDCITSLQKQSGVMGMQHASFKILPPKCNFQGNTASIFTDIKGMERESWEVRWFISIMERTGDLEWGSSGLSLTSRGAWVDYLLLFPHLENEDK